MALMIPKFESEFNGSYGEKLAYNSLKNLEDEFVVFHSFNWSAKSNNRFKEGEGDLVIYDPRFGILVVEIKSGGMRVSEGVWYQTNLRTRVEKTLRRSPLVQADNTRWIIRDILEDNNIDIRVYSAIWLTSISNPNKKIDDPHVNNEVILWKEDLERPRQAFKRVFEFYNVKEKEYDPELRRGVINSLAPQFDVMPTGRDLIDFNESNFVRMTSEQTRILNFLVEQREAAIMGGAGTGKTLLAVEQAKRLSVNGKVLLLCFNQLLREDLIERVEKHPNVEVHNIYTFAQKYLAFKKKIFEPDEISNLLIDFDYNKWPFEHVIIDEGQDINPDHILLLKNINDNNTDGFFYVFYDENQTVQLREELSWKQELSCQLVLSINCRNTKNIAETSHSVLENKKHKVMSDIDGDKATLERVNDKDELIDKLGKLISDYLEEGYQREDIVILTHKTMENSLLSDIVKVGRYSLSKNVRTPRQIFFTTSRRFKGLESPILILIDLDKNSFDTLENRRLFYVATSRAKSNLNLLFNGSSDDFDMFMTKYIDIETRFVKNRFSQELNVEVL